MQRREDIPQPGSAAGCDDRGLGPGVMSGHVSCLSCSGDIQIQVYRPKYVSRSY